MFYSQIFLNSKVSHMAQGFTELISQILFSAISWVEDKLKEGLEFNPHCFKDSQKQLQSYGLDRNFNISS